MKQEDKELLLQDLCARLLHGVKCCVKNNHKVCGILNGIVGENIHLYSSGCSTYNISVIKPYLFPLSSMTDEQRNEYHELLYNPKHGIDIDYFDWCHKNHLDCRGLIEKGLAIDASNLNIY